MYGREKTYLSLVKKLMYFLNGNWPKKFENELHLAVERLQEVVFLLGVQMNKLSWNVERNFKYHWLALETA